jgi:signal transduction histidine kinase/CheY-like chemotaxis protein
MWYTSRIVPKADTDFISSAHELLLSTSRNLISVTGGIYLVWHLVSTTIWPEQLGANVWLVTPVIALTLALALYALPRRFLAAQAIWQAGLAGAITLAVYLFQRPEIAFFYALLPLMAVVTVGWPAGLLVEGVIAFLAWWLFHGLLLQPPPITYGLGCIIGAAIAGVLGWVSSHTLLTVTHWSLYSFNQAQQTMEEVRDRRAELARALKELDQAYYRLERANHMLVLARAEAEEAREARNRFALAVSHELRTPLNFILGFSELMVNAPATYAALERWPPGLYGDVQEIYRSSAHLLRLVNDVLDLGQIEAMRMVLNKEWVMPAQMIQEVEAMVRSAFARRGLWFKMEVDPDLPEMFLDRTRIRQVLLNLVSNSLRVTEQGGVTVRLHKEDSALLFQVQDTGPGIAKGDVQGVFEEFHQVGKGSWRRCEGTGLGIPISRRFVELHGGRMWLESEVGEGACFYFTIPVPGAMQDSLAVPDDEGINARYWRHLKEKAKGAKLLFVLSPDPVAGEVIVPYVEGYGVVTVCDPDQVRVKAAELLPSALIVDQAMIDDQEVRSMLHGLPYDLPVISFVFPGSPGHFRDLPAGVVNYLVKPVERQELAQAVRALGPGVRNLLVVDDDPAMIRFVTQVFKSVFEGSNGHDGYRLITASTGREALERLREDEPDAVLLDLALPDISGWQVLEEFQQDEIPVILITAYDWPQFVSTGEQEALRIVMRRPLSRHELAPVLKCLLETIRPAYPQVSTEPTPPTGPSA